MTDISNILKYFDDFSEEQIKQFEMLGPIYKEKNQEVNVISRKDIDALYIHHVLHSLSIYKFMPFAPGTTVLDVGTGGGFPGIPLAIACPESQFLLVDGKGKKIKVVSEVIEALGLKNAAAQHKRSEEIKFKFDFVLARAVTRMNKLLPMCLHLVSDTHLNILPNGLIGLKGGDLTEEIEEVSQWHDVDTVTISKFFNEEYFDQKYVFYIQA